MRQRGRELAARIGAERQDRELSAQQLQSEVRKHFQSAFVSSEQKTLAHFARVEAQHVAPGERQ